MTSFWAYSHTETNIPFKAVVLIAIYIDSWIACTSQPFSQLLPADSIAIKLKELAHKRFVVLVQMGLSGLLGCWVVGAMSFFLLDVVKAARIIDTMISVTAAFGVSGIE